MTLHHWHGICFLQHSPNRNNDINGPMICLRSCLFGCLSLIKETAERDGSPLNHINPNSRHSPPTLLFSLLSSSPLLTLSSWVEGSLMISMRGGSGVCVSSSCSSSPPLCIPEEDLHRVPSLLLPLWRDRRREAVSTSS